MRRLVLLFAGSFAALRITRGAKPPLSGEVPPQGAEGSTP